MISRNDLNEISCGGNAVPLELKKENPAMTKNSDFWYDMMNCMIGIVWQSSMIVVPIYFVIRDYPKAYISLAVFLLTSIILKFTWLDKVRKIPN